ncbi:MAG: glycoside hydrolase family 32 protein [Mangrovimonas sp.]|nr:glycoside hydrolase family 32 protein [Mangrovimonas sp.]MCB0434625.1 glycoside hydrolase family 32 protein [Mangrovimonas sp.]MCB0437263.1 glycoside hydrolase family 32 protein [Mangrovimonas sp.]MCB0470387.1 glycoside hydrolase family 32 protein [Flavobacteriaceae bacterium]
MKIFTAKLILLGFTTFFIGCKDANTSDGTITATEVDKTTLSEEQLYRPNFHFTPKANWMNDPNGMFYLDGVYHLFFQYYPDGNKWGPMHWGHATSTDLVSWKEQPIALYPDELGYIFSGSAVVDRNNTSGFGDGTNVPIVAIFTYHNPIKEKEGKIDVETQGVAYSLDNGKSWTKYENNPVLDNPGIRDFRDPKVIWDEEHQKWVMALAAHDRTQFYGSKNLKDWEFLSEFGAGTGAHGGVWECPDFFPMHVDGTSETKWVLLQSLNPGGPNGGSGTQYFIGDFDGKTFKMDPSFSEQLSTKKAIWIDYGKDNYAGVTWDNVPDGKRFFIGWMSNWLYAQEVPTETWRSSMTLPRELKLIFSNGTYKLLSSPIGKLKNLYGQTIVKKDIVFKKKTVLLDSGNLDLSRLVIDIELKEMKDDKYTFTVENDKGNQLFFGIDNKDKYIFIDRKKSGKIDFSEAFSSKISRLPLNQNYETINLKLVFDKTSLEIFLNGGEMAMTELFFPEVPYQTLSVESSNKDCKIAILKANEINLTNNSNI